MNSKINAILKVKKDKEKITQYNILKLQNEISKLQKHISELKSKIKNSNNEKVISAYELKLVYIYKNSLQKEISSYKKELSALNKRLNTLRDKLKELQIEILKYETILKKEKEKLIEEEKRKELNLMNDINNINSARKLIFLDNI